MIFVGGDLACLNTGWTEEGAGSFGCGARACSASKNAFASLSSGASESSKPTAPPRAAATARTFLAARACVTCTADVGKLCAAGQCRRWPSLLDGLLQCLCRVTLKQLHDPKRQNNYSGAGAVSIEAAFSSAGCYASTSEPGCKCECISMSLRQVATCITT